MEPKIRAAIDYLERGGKAVLITMPETITLSGATGTWILPDGASHPGYVATRAGLLQDREEAGESCLGDR